jgi:hypothetical protein
MLSVSASCLRNHHAYYASVAQHKQATCRQVTARLCIEEVRVLGLGSLHAHPLPDTSQVSVPLTRLDVCTSAISLIYAHNRVMTLEYIYIYI